MGRRAETNLPDAEREGEYLRTPLSAEEVTGFQAGSPPLARTVFEMKAVPASPYEDWFTNLVRVFYRFHHKVVGPAETGEDWGDPPVFYCHSIPAHMSQVRVLHLGENIRDPKRGSIDKPHRGTAVLYSVGKG